MGIQSEQAFECLIQHLGKIPSNIQRHSLVALRYAHLYLLDVAARFWQARLSGTSTVDLSDEHYTVFYDAAWELARIGVLRTGRVVPRNMETANDFGDHWSITNWLRMAREHVASSISGHESHVPGSCGFCAELRPGFGQRAVDAVRT